MISEALFDSSLLTIYAPVKLLSQHKEFNLCKRLVDERVST